MKRFRIVCLLLLLILPAAKTAAAQELDFNSKAQLLMEVESRQILYENNIHEKLYPASVTKIMTMLLAMEALESGKAKLEDMVTVSEQAAAHGGSQIFLSPGDSISFEDLLIGIGVGSANDGAWAMAEFLAGSAGEFVERMNEKARSLGMRNTHFVNPHGLHHENHYTTAYDTALMSLALLRHPQIHRWLTIWMDEEFLKGKIQKSEGVYLSNSNRLVRFYEGGDGLKTGFTNEAGNCISATAKRGNTRYLAVVMGAAGRPALFSETQALLDYGFANYYSVPIVRAGEALAELSVDKGLKPKVEVVARDSLALLLKKGDSPDLEREIVLPERLRAPLSKNMPVGRLIIRYADGRELGEVDLVPAGDVQRAKFLTIFVRFARQWLKGGS